jgi:ribosome-associated heat shock protein Hsp15
MDPAVPLTVRVDVWLDVACLFRTRSEAQGACRSGRIEIGGAPVKAHRLVKAGDEIRIRRPFGRVQTITVRGLTDRHVSKAEARLLYEDLTPKLTPEEIEQRRLARIYRAAMTPPKAPDKRARRALRKLKEGQG